MGDRGNVYVHKGDTPGVYLYTHWMGNQLPDIVKRALAREERWDDTPYLTRIIFSEMTRGYEAEATGFGISAQPRHGALIDVDTATGTVRLPGRNVQMPFSIYILSDF